MTTVILKPKKEESLKRFHPWVFSGAIARVLLDASHKGDAPVEGELVSVRSAANEVLGIGHWQVGSIAVRILAFGVEQLPSDFWCERIRAAYKVREAIGLIRPDNNTFRLIHGEGDFLPGLIVDVYADTAVVQAHSIGMHESRNEIANALMSEIPQVQNVYYKSDDTLPFKASIEGDKVGYLIKNQKSQIKDTDEFWSVENGLEFRIDWLRGQKTGFFVDQRENRALVERYASGKDVLNMFCYTGGFSLYALRGGAKTVDSVDVSQKAIDLVNINVARNFPNDPRHHAYAADAFDFLSEKITNHKSPITNPQSPITNHQSPITNYDLIILDPPAFAKHRDAVKNALRGYQRINAKAIEKIRPGGILFTFSCSQAVDKEAFRLAVFSAAAQVGRKVRILHQLHQPQDHPINIYHPEGEYLKGLVLYVE
ncbi:MAG: class I SAM-dependent rRNA methyltransferase [Bacteroidales bacterium]|nr:class I SAM-dependent rRNA methyltransferase [Bacteroidales bacterium]MDY6406911.1 class I SAM-dependent rRNA methyltransferase [Bacteroidales bacterium]